MVICIQFLRMFGAAELDVCIQWFYEFAAECGCVCVYIYIDIVTMMLMSMLLEQLNVLFTSSNW